MNKAALEYSSRIRKACMLPVLYSSTNSSLRPVYLLMVMPVIGSGEFADDADYEIILTVVPVSGINDI